jgi:hypothetical protein
VLGVIAPVEGSIVSPAGEAVNVPPLNAPVPVNVTERGVVIDVQNGVPA